MLIQGRLIKLSCLRVGGLFQGHLFKGALIQGITVICAMTEISYQIIGTLTTQRGDTPELKLAPVASQCIIPNELQLVWNDVPVYHRSLMH